MGILNSGFNLYEIAFSLFKSDNTLRIFELGNQIGMEEVPFRGLSSKEYLTSLGHSHISMDLNGRNGALARDITKDISDLGVFDLVTNFGSSEHVEPFCNQYLCFRNLHQLCKPGGVIIHQVPETDTWKDHSPAHYELSFFKKLSDLNKYHVHLIELDQSDLISCVLVKIADSDFIQEDCFPFNNITWDEVNPYKGNYT